MIRTPNVDKLYPKENDNASAGMVGKVTDETVQVRKSVSSTTMMVLDFISRLRFTAGKHGARLQKQCCLQQLKLSFIGSYRLICFPVSLIYTFSFACIPVPFLSPV